MTVVLAGIVSAGDPPAKATAKVKGTPDLLQTSNEAKFAGGGTQFCAPVAVSNSFMWLATHGFKNLAPKTKKGDRPQFEMVEKLASERLMNTSTKIGTSPSGLMQGVRNYVETSGYSCKRLDYQGWRPISIRSVTVDSTIPDLNWIKQGIADPNGAVWINVGWYRKVGGKYTRIGGHWITVVGYGVDKSRRLTPNALIVKDPSGRSGVEPRSEYITVKAINAGTLEGKKKGLPRNAKGFMTIAGDLKVKKGANCAIVDAVVVVILDRK